MKKFFIILAVLIAFSADANAQMPNPVEMQQAAPIQNYTQNLAEYKVSAIDPTPSTNPPGAFYPGLRGGNQLIVYTKNFGTSTGTNEYGREAVISNGVVTEITGSDTTIPLDGFVVSGHGDAKNWLTKNLMVGAKVTLDSDKGIIKSVITPESYVYRADRKINDVVKIIASYQKENKSYKSAQSDDFLNKAMAKLLTANNYIEAEDYTNAISSADEAAKLADSAIYYAIPSKAGEIHGVWIRPTQRSVQEIDAALDKMLSAGIQDVFLETYFQSYTIFPSKTLASYGIQPQRKEFLGWDPLQVWIDEAHKRNMRIHVWFQTFYAGNDNIAAIPSHVLSVHPDWANVQYLNYNSERPMPSRSEHNGYFLDPANPQVQTYLLSLLSEIVQNYNVDGLNIDYIRYPASLSPDFPNYTLTTWGYSQYARNEFQQLNGVDPANLTPDDSLWKRWVSYRQDKVTAFVSKLKPLTAGKNIIITTVIFPDAKEGPIVKNQNWPVWGQNKYVDAFTPLIMGSDELSAQTKADLIRLKSDGKAAVLTGLFEPFTAGSPVDMLKQINASRKANSSGIILFDYAHLSPEYINALNASAFKSN